MPNLQAAGHHDRRGRAHTGSASAPRCRRTARFEPLMTLYLTDNTSADEIARAKASGFVHAVKYYPAGATTNSDSGVTALARVYARAGGDGAPRRRAVRSMAKSPIADVDVFDRERVFVERAARARSCATFRRCASCSSTSRRARPRSSSRDARRDVAATITPQHLLYSRNALFAGGIAAASLLPAGAEARDAPAGAGRRRDVGQSEILPRHRLARRTRTHTKENACGCAGCYSAPVALPLYAEAFEDAGALDRLEGFASVHGADFYGLPRNGDTVTLVREPWRVPDELRVRRRDDRAAARRRESCAGKIAERPVARLMARL